MEHREIGRTGMRASVVAFGGMRFFKKPEDEALATVRRAVDLGVTLFETGSYGGGRSEELLGMALEGYCPRESVVLANKCVVGDRPDAAAVRAQLEASLERERTDHFDLYSFWGVNTRDLMDHCLTGGPLDAVEKAKAQGLVRAVGFTTHARPEWIREFADLYPWDCVTLKEHMLYSRQRETLEYLGGKGIGVIVMTPLAGGVICRPSDEIAREVAAAGTSMPVLALRYLVSDPNITCAISGMAAPEEVEENVTAGETGSPLTETERGLVDFIREKTTRLGEKFCTGCGYCMPCPSGVNIPGVFHLWNLKRGFGNDGYSRLEYGKMLRAEDTRHWADFVGLPATACTECGECLEKCPEGLPIVEDLKRAHEELTG
ncbi:MAG: aldo/keto reductase [Planctomycetota bacterium]|jgi:predicted aldo/keto reductase-like oxidoreductase